MHVANTVLPCEARVAGILKEGAAVAGIGAPQLYLSVEEKHEALQNIHDPDQAADHRNGRSFVCVEKHEGGNQRYDVRV